MDKNKDKDYEDLIDKSISFSKKNDLDSAKLFLEKAINLNPKKSISYINLSNIYILQNNLKLSTKILYDYLKKHNLDLEVINHYGKICIKFNLIDQLIEFKKFLLKKNNIKKIFKIKKISYSSTPIGDNSLTKKLLNWKSKKNIIIAANELNKL